MSLQSLSGETGLPADRPLVQPSFQTMALLQGIATAFLRETRIVIDRAVPPAEESKPAPHASAPVPRL